MITLNFNPGDLIRVHQKIIEGEKERVQVFEGTVLAIKGEGNRKTFTVRKVIDGIGVERIWPISSPLLEKVVVKAHPKKPPRRAKLYYLRKVK